jgi:hypothetical protein
VQLVEKCVIKMKNLKEIKLMMERLESPRLTETELNYKKSLLKEENEETTQDPDQLDLFTGETKEVNELVAEFEEIKKLILDEIEGLDINYLYSAMSMGQMDRELEDYYNSVQKLENWIDSNDFEGELMREANNLLEVLEYGPIDYEITLTPEVEELLKKERPSIKVGSEKELSAMSEGKDEMGRMVMDVDTYREYLIKQMKNKGLLSSEDKKEYLERWLKYQEPIGGKKKMADRIEAAQTLLDEL